MCAKSFPGCPTLCNPQSLLSMGFSRQEYWSRLPFPPPGNLYNPGIDPVSYISCTEGGFFTTSATWETLKMGHIKKIF